MVDPLDGVRASEIKTLNAITDPLIDDIVMVCLMSSRKKNAFGKNLQVFSEIGNVYMSLDRRRRPERCCVEQQHRCEDLRLPLH